MSSLILLPRLRVENANAIAGLTWGFPAITHFMGYMHALSRTLSASHGLTLAGCAVICHDYQVHAYTSGRDFQFALTRNPLNKEEGRMHLTVSLLLECHGEIVNCKQGRDELAEHLQTLCEVKKLAGGTIFGMEKVSVMSYPETESDRRRLLYRLLPGFALLDRSAWLEAHYQALGEHDASATWLDA